MTVGTILILSLPLKDRTFVLPSQRMSASSISVKQGDGMKKIVLIEAIAHGLSIDAQMTEAPWFSHRSFIVATGLALGIIMAMVLHSASASAVDDRNAVAALDTEYQAAVKKNDAVTMGRILADDFVLVTGSGKTYTKADMLKRRAERGHKLRT
jgi:hypothetical protein